MPQQCQIPIPDPLFSVSEQGPWRRIPKCLIQSSGASPRFGWGCLTCPKSVHPSTSKYKYFTLKHLNTRHTFYTHFHPEQQNIQIVLWFVKYIGHSLKTNNLWQFKIKSIEGQFDNHTNSILYTFIHSSISSLNPLKSSIGRPQTILKLLQRSEN